MPRVIESAEDEDQGWGVRKSPYEYNGTIRSTPTLAESNDTNPGSLGDALERGSREANPTGLQSIQRTSQTNNPRAAQRKIKPLELYDKLSDIPQVGDVMEGLVPVGDSGLYSVPDDAAQPNDCERWPDSPACSNQPLSALPIGFEDQEIVSDDCNLGFSVTPVAGFIKLPKYQLVYRKPECREPPPDFSGQNEWDFYDAPPQFQPIPMPPRPRSCVPRGYDFYCWVGLNVVERTLSRSLTVDFAPREGTSFGMYAWQYTNKISLPIENAPPITMFNIRNAQNTFLKVPQITCTYEGNAKSQQHFAVTGSERRWDWPDDHKEYNTSGEIKGKCYFELNNICDFSDDGQIGFVEGRESYYDYRYEIYLAGGSAVVPQIIYGRYSKIVKYIETVYAKVEIPYNLDASWGYVKRKSSTDYGATIAWIKVDGTNELIIPDCPKKNKPPEEKKRKGVVWDAALQVRAMIHY